MIWHNNTDAKNRNNIYLPHWKTRQIIIVPSKTGCQTKPVSSRHVRTLLFFLLWAMKPLEDRCAINSLIVLSVASFFSDHAECREIQSSHALFFFLHAAPTTRIWPYNIGHFQPTKTGIRAAITCVLCVLLKEDCKQILSKNTFSYRWIDANS